MTSMKRNISQALDYFLIWYICNALLYLATLFLTIFVEVQLGEAGLGPSKAIREAFVALPYLLVLMVIPSLLIVAISWVIRVKSTWMFRAVTFALLLLPCVWSESLEQFVLKAIAQALFACLMIRSRTAESVSGQVDADSL